MGELEGEEMREIIIDSFAGGGGAITDNHIDIVFPSRNDALQFGRQEVNVMVIEQAF